MSIVVMEEQSQPVFRDFLGSAPPPGPALDSSKQPEMSATDSVRVSQNSGFMEQEDGEASVRGGSTFSGPSAAAAAPNFAASSDPDAEIWRHSKSGAPFTKAPGCMNDDNVRKRDELGSRGPYRENLNDSAEGSRPAKISRFKQRETDALPSTGDLCLAMQPPRAAQGGGANLWLQTSVFKTDPSTGTSKRLDGSSRPTGGMPLLSRPLQVPPGAAAAAAAGGMYSRNPASSSMQPPPADEGSRTGLQGGGIAALINNANVKLPSAARPAGEASILERSASLERPKLPLQNGAPDSHKTSTTSATRQLTIFYGGHAHVFDDVSPDKADAIMQLAGSNGRSWSTTYAHRSSRSEGSLIDMERRSRDGGKPVNGSSSSMGVPAEMQTALQSLNYPAAGVPRKHHRIPTEQPKLPADVQHPSAMGDGNRFAVANGRATNLQSSYYNLKEAASNGQHWL